ncbi:MAG: vanadium-dependent haloperoxidase [Acidobacteriaceae bacterium]|nr:vanadium-dependent haloperoxidase [Acidobacteriaceae bacterium]
MKKLSVALSLVLLSSVCAKSQQINPVIQWNQVLLQLLRTPGVQPATIHPTRNMALLHTAIYEAVNSIDGSHEPYSASIPVLVAGASADAAADAAAFGVLNALYPAKSSLIETAYQNLLASIPEGAAKTEGIRVGTAAASELLALRANDHSSDPAPTLTLGTGAGQYRLTPPNFPKPVFTGWSHVDLFALLAANQFRPGPPPALTSQEYTDAFNEVKSNGLPRSTVATTDQQLTGWFWNGAIQNYWNEIAQYAAFVSHLDTAQNARLFALLNMSLADTVIAFYDAKYTYVFWRPVTAIQNADIDGNPDTLANPTWLPETKTTAADPSYPGAHAAISNAAATVLSSFFGSDSFAFKVDSEVFAGVVRSFSSFSAAAQEATDSRVFAGQHFRFDLTAGQQLGTNVAQFVVGSKLQPVTK